MLQSVRGFDQTEVLWVLGPRKTAAMGEPFTIRVFVPDIASKW